MARRQTGPGMGAGSARPALQRSESGSVTATAALALTGRSRDTWQRAVPDGDTLHVHLAGYLGVRMLGIDTPEVSGRLPGDHWAPLSHGRWVEFLADPFGPDWPPFDPPLDAELMQHVQERTSGAAASNHHRHALAAQEALKAEIRRDSATMSQDETEFRIFLAFAHEIMDRYGRLLAWTNRFQPEPRRPSPRPPTYNERLLGLGVALPYWIWPNVRPFLRYRRLVDAVPGPGKAAELAEGDPALRAAREAVKRARSRGRGVFSRRDPLQLLPFELRYLSDRRPPERWVIDLAKEDDILIPPQRYYLVPAPEDRLFIPDAYVPLFINAGWRPAGPGPSHLTDRDRHRGTAVSRGGRRCS